MIESYEGSAGHAVLVTGQRGDQTDAARLGAFVLDVPGAHPFWRYYLLSVISLRDIEGFPPATLEFSGAEYELAIYALDPSSPPDPASLDTFHLLQPRNVSVQFGGVTEGFAIHLCEQAVRVACDGHLPVEPMGVNDANEAWRRSIRDTVQHHLEGRHDHDGGD